jgi:hypothetical protein
LNHHDLVLHEIQMKTKIVPPIVFDEKNHIAQDNDNTNTKLDQVLLKLDAVIQENETLRNAVLRENEWRRQQVNIVLFTLLAAAVHYLFPK